jgi:hypothetical protein
MLEVQCNDAQVVAIFGKVVKSPRFTTARVHGVTNFGRKRGDVLEAISVLCSEVCAFRFIDVASDENGEQ